MRRQTVIEEIVFDRFCRRAFHPAVPILIPELFSEELGELKTYREGHICRIHHKQDISLPETMDEDKLVSLRPKIRQLRRYGLNWLDQTEEPLPVIAQTMDRV